MYDDTEEYPVNSAASKIIPFKLAGTITSSLALRPSAAGMKTAVRLWVDVGKRHSVRLVAVHLKGQLVNKLMILLNRYLHIRETFGSQLQE
jgi:hypothetical protein